MNPIRLCRKTLSSARERVIFSPGKDGEAGDIGFIVDGAGDLGLSLKAGDALIVPGKGPRQDLDRHLTVELGVGGSIDLAHAALAELACYFIVCVGGIDHWLFLTRGEFLTHMVEEVLEQDYVI